MDDKIAVVGAGSWATALAIMLANKNYPVLMWGRRKELINEINEQGVNSRYLPGAKIPARLKASTDLAEVVKNARVVVLGVPAQAQRGVLKDLKPLVNSNSLFVNTAKGIEQDSLLRLSQVFSEVMGDSPAKRYGVLSGPSHAEEVGQGIPTTIVASSDNREVAETIQDIFMTPQFRVYTNPDIVGVELAGALKNVIALGTGISDGLGYGDNTKAALITRGLAEISRLGLAMGANLLTFAGLAGIGDLIVTCTSMHSRNRRAGIEIGRGSTVEEAMAKVNMVVEGVTTAQAAYQLSLRHKIEMPITTIANKVLFEGFDAKEAVGELMTRQKTHEMEEVAMEMFKQW